jgi:hypothetical protein
MPALLTLCWRAYDVSLRFYPVELREAFGDDMRDVFRQQTRDAWTDGGWRLLARVLWCAIRELFTEALPIRAGSPVAVAGVSSLVCTSAVFWCLLWAFQNPLAARAVECRLERLLWGG